MTRCLHIISILVLLIVFGCQTKHESQESPSGVAAHIKKLEQECLDAYIHGDTATLNRLLADDYTIGFASGTGFGTKATEIGGIQGAVDSNYILRHDTLVVRVYRNVAVVTKALTEKGSYAGSRIDAQLLYTNIWVKINGEWRLAASHGTQIPPTR
ncbi:MAG: nuclear transport factor 2 family protein [Ignavibacteriae bacterium]|nr:nuclear transport factor 2 family protein [Ignavibacteriota bacterium]